MILHGKQFRTLAIECRADHAPGSDDVLPVEEARKCFLCGACTGALYH